MKTEGLTQLRNVYPADRSSSARIDPLFRPWTSRRLPTARIYIVGHVPRHRSKAAQWAKEGTYLRAKIKQYQLDKVIAATAGSGG